MSFESLGKDADKVFDGFVSNGVNVKASTRLALSDALTSSLYVRLRTTDSNAGAVSLAPKFKVRCVCVCVCVCVCDAKSRSTDVVA
jgi:hypothetical protein